MEIKAKRGYLLSWCFGGKEKAHPLCFPATTSCSFSSVFTTAPVFAALRNYSAQCALYSSILRIWALEETKDGDLFC